MNAGIDSAKKLIDLGGDWDRRNRLKVYEALHLITARDVKAAAALLLECVSTFTCTELCSYNDFILYTVVTNILALPRTTLKKKIVDGPEVGEYNMYSNWIRCDSVQNPQVGPVQFWRI